MRASCRSAISWIKFRIIYVSAAWTNVPSEGNLVTTPTSIDCCRQASSRLVIGIHHPSHSTDSGRDGAYHSKTITRNGFC